MKNSGTNKFISFIKSNSKLLLLFAFLAFMNLFFLAWSLHSNAIAISQAFIPMAIITILVEVILCIIIFFAKSKSWPIHKIFLILASIIGSFYVIAIPVGRGPDEESHFARVYELTEGNLISEVDSGTAGTYQPATTYVVREIARHNIAYSEIDEVIALGEDGAKIFIPTSADGYNFISYFPQFIGMSIGKLFHLPFYISGYLAKFFTLFACIAVLYFCIKFTPFFKEIIFFIAFLPSTMQSMTTITADAPITIAAITLVSFILYATFTMKSTFTIKHYLLIFAIGLFLSISKITYAPLCLLLFTIPTARFKSLKNKLLWIIGIGISIFAIYLLWRFLTPPTRSAYDAGVQISAILGSPIHYLAIVLRSICTDFIPYLTGALGGFLEWFNINLQSVYLIASFVAFILLVQKSRTEAFITKSFKYLSMAIFALITLATFTAMFITWTKPGEPIIDGVQGRYFLPLLLLIPTWFVATKSIKSAKTTKPAKSTPSISTKLTQNYYLYGFFIFESIYALTTIACTHL